MAQDEATHVSQKSIIELVQPEHSLALEKPRSTTAFEAISALIAAGAVGLVVAVTLHWCYHLRYFSAGTQDIVPAPAHELGWLLKHSLSWFVCPGVTVVLAWMLRANPASFRQRFTAIWNSYAHAAIEQLMPIHPASLSQAFALGRLHDQLFGAETAVSDEHANTAAAPGVLTTLACEDQILEAAAKIAGRQVSSSELRALPSELVDIERGARSKYSRISAILSLANVFWLIGLLGLVITIGPTIWVLLKPMRSILELMWLQFVWPFVQTYLLQRWRVYEPMGYGLAVWLLVDSSRYPKDKLSMAGTMTAVTAVVVFCVAWCYTTSLNAAAGGDSETYSALTGGLICAFSVPMVVMHRSRLLAYVAVFACLAAMGFGVWGSQLCIILGFRTRDALARTAMGALFLTILNMYSHCWIARSKPAEDKSDQTSLQYWHEPFGSALSTVGTSVFLISLDILSFHIWWSSRDGFNASCLYCAAVLCLLVASEVLGMTAMANVARTFTGLFMLTHYWALAYHLRSSDALTLWTFGLFGVLYWGSFYLHRHPKVLTQMFLGTQ